MTEDDITAKLQRDFNAGSTLKHLYVAMQVARRSGQAALPAELEWLKPLFDRYTNDLPGFRAYLLNLCIARGQYRVKMEGAGDHQVLRDLYRLVYQNTTMMERRARLAKAIEIYRRAGHTFSNITRAKTESRQIAHWAAQRQAYLDKVKASRGGKLSWEERNAAIEKFWSAIDAKLDEQLKSTE